MLLTGLVDVPASSWALVEPRQPCFGAHRIACNFALRPRRELDLLPDDQTAKKRARAAATNPKAKGCPCAQRSFDLAADAEPAAHCDVQGALLEHGCLVVGAAAPRSTMNPGDALTGSGNARKLASASSPDGRLRSYADIELLEGLATLPRTGGRARCAAPSSPCSLRSRIPPSPRERPQQACVCGVVWRWRMPTPDNTTPFTTRLPILDGAWQVQVAIERTGSVSRCGRMDTLPTP